MSSERTSSSCPSPTFEWEYDVYLSFRGEDTRRGFTNNLYNSLEDQGIKTFMDDRELQKGKSISPELFTAIEKSNIALIVLSLNYASSTWCLDELVKILECMEARETILPIFLDVDPCDVRRQTGTFAEAFTKHETRLMGDTEKVQRWRAALTKVSNFSGWNSKDFRHELELIKNVVATVRTRSPPNLFSSVENLIGIDSRVEGVNNFLLGVAVADVHFIGIWGMGGIGKTTIARALFDRISHQFDFSSFISDVRSNEETSGLVQIQKKIISRILGKEIDVWDAHEGAMMIKRLLHHKKVLLVLDDVNKADHLVYLAGKKDWFGSGSRIIITSRNDHLLVYHGVMRRFKVQGLNRKEALQLFCQHAFRRNFPEERYRNLTYRVVNYTKGLPLAIKVLGSFLHGRGESAWESALASLRKVFDEEIFETLKISYDGLCDNEKKIFLDIACFYNGYEETVLRRILDSCGFDATIGIEVLAERSLLSISDAGNVEMHDLLQEMGLEIVRRESNNEPGKRSRLCHIEDIIQVLGKNRGTEVVLGIVMRANKYADRELQLPGKSFSMLKNLRILIFDGVRVHLSDGLEYVSNELRIIVWWKCPLQSLASLNSLENLQELEMRHSRIEYLWEGKKHLYSLKRIDLSHSLTLLKTPDFSGCPYLEELNLQGCIQLYEVDSSVGFLDRLTHMYLKCCRNLGLLPSSVSGLKKLKILDLSDCSKLEKLPEDLGDLESLEVLYVNGTALRELPSCGGLQNLKKLLFFGCRGPPISKLLPSFAGLHSLTELGLSFCNLLEGAIPNDLGCLSSLTELWLHGNQFVTLPKSLSQLYNLEVLDLTDCRELRNLPELPSRVLVFASNCISLEIVPEHLSCAYFFNCLKLAKQGCNSVAFKSMKRHLQEVSQDHNDMPFEFVIPGNGIPEWFDNQTEAASISIDLHPGWFNKDLVGFALCFVYAVHGHHQLPPVFKNRYEIRCIVNVDGQELNSMRVDYSFRGMVGRTVSDHLRFYCDHRLSSYFRDVETTELKQIEFSFRAKGHGLVVKKCGVRLVYEQDVAEIMECKAEISDEALEIPPCDSGKAAVATHVISLRDLHLPYSHGRPSGSAFSFYKEPRPDILKGLRRKSRPWGCAATSAAQGT